MQANESYCADTTIPYEESSRATENTHAAPATRLQSGKVMVIGGTLVSFLGVAIYCAPIFSEALRNDPQRFMPEGLGLISAGVAIWLMGAVKYLNAAIETGEDSSI